MKICFPVEEFAGLQSTLFGHFGSAPRFLLVDTETREIRELSNADQDHAHGMCNPLRALGNVVVDAIVVGGIGAGALSGLRRAGIKVFQAQAPSVADNLACLAEAELPELTPEQVCGGHPDGQDCCH